MPLPIRARIEAANTDLQAANDTHQRLMAYNTSRPTVNVDDEFRAKLLEGADPATLLDSYAEAKTRQTRAEQFGYVVASVLQRLTAPVALEAAFTSTALAMCRDELTNIMNRVDEHRDLLSQHPATADAAIRTGNLADYETVETILDDYDALRAEYGRQLRLEDNNLNPTVIKSVHCRHFLDVDPGWLLRRSRASILEGYPDRQIWEWFRAHPESAELSRAEHLLTIADNEPWLPTADELQTVTNAAEQLCHHRWHTGTVGRDRTEFARLTAIIRNTTHGEPIPEPSTARSLA